MHYKHSENMWPLRLRLHWIWSLMLLTYNVSHMGQHFSIKQSGMKRSAVLLSAYRQVLFQCIRLTLSTFYGTSGPEFSLFLCAFCGRLWMNSELMKPRGKNKRMTAAKRLLMNVLSRITRSKIYPHCNQGPIQHKQNYERGVYLASTFI